MAITMAITAAQTHQEKYPIGKRTLSDPLMGLSNVSFRCGSDDPVPMVPRSRDIVRIPDNPADHSIARCRACGTELGRWVDPKAAAAKIMTRTILD